MVAVPVGPVMAVSPRSSRRIIDRLAIAVDVIGAIIAGLVIAVLIIAIAIVIRVIAVTVIAVAGGAADGQQARSEHAEGKSDTFVTGSSGIGHPVMIRACHLTVR